PSPEGIEDAGRSGPARHAALPRVRGSAEPCTCVPAPVIPLEPPEMGLQRLRAAEEHAAPAAKVARDPGFEPGPLPGGGQLVQEGGYLPRRVQDRGEGDPSTLIGRQPGRLGGLEPGCERPGRSACGAPAMHPAASWPGSAGAQTAAVHASGGTQRLSIGTCWQPPAVQTSSVHEKPSSQPPPPAQSACGSVVLVGSEGSVTVVVV